MKYFLVGIKGAGMSALAQILKDEGHDVEGMDVNTYIFTEKELFLKGIFIHPLEYREFENECVYIIGHDFMKSDIFIYLQQHNMRIYEYHCFLKIYMKDKFSLAISGTHGKTTTTGMLGHIFKDDPISCLIGDGTGFSNKNANTFIFEACEYQDHFLKYNPDAIIITNIDYDHVDYFKTEKQYVSSFNQFVNCGDVIFINYEDKDKISHPNIITYGSNNHCDCYFFDNKIVKNGQIGTIFIKNKKYHYFLPLFGKHNLYHLTAIVAYLDYYNLDVNYYLKKMENFTGVKRRMTRTLINDEVFIDDYAHHPNEIIASINSVREMYPSHKIIVFFKPDRYSRLTNFKDEFIKALRMADMSFVLPLYEANRYQGSRILCDEKTIYFLYDEKDVKRYHFELKNTVFLMMSSKDMTNLMKEIVKKYENKH